MSLDPAYITSVDLNPYLVDKDTGAPLAGGVIQFWQDDSRSTPKTVYQLTGSPPNYTYAALPNPVVLSATGTIEDNNGNNCALYYYPFDANGNIQLYYIVVLNSMGVIQFTREAWPNTTPESNPVTAQNNTIVNMLSNPQFAEVLFDVTTGAVIPYTASTNASVEIAPDWYLDIEPGAGGGGTVTVTRQAISGISNTLTQPPYTLTINPTGGNLSKLSLRQRLYQNPNIWSGTPGLQNGWVGTTIVLGNQSDVTIQYAPSGGGTAQTILQENNQTGGLFEYSLATQLPPGNNPLTADTNGYTDIIIYVNDSRPTILTSVQVVPLASNVDTILFEQTPVNRQVDQLFHYYAPILSAKPTPSYLIGWDFPLNPAQALTSTVAAFATGTNTSNYVWDQTIAFQTQNSAVSFSRASTGALRVTAASNPAQFALVQYLDQATARDLLNNRLSVNVAAVTSITDGIFGTVSLWYTSNSSLPAMSSNASVVASLDANGYPVVQTGWHEVPRGLAKATFTITGNATLNFNDYEFSGWDMEGIAAVGTTTFFAIVVGFADMTSTDTVDFGSISLVPGDIATRPAPESAAQVLAKCQAFYEKSFAIGTLPANGVGVGTGEIAFLQGFNGTSSGLPRSPTISYKVTKRIPPVVVTTYNPSVASPTPDSTYTLWNENRSVSDTVTGKNNISQNGFQIAFNTGSSSATGDALTTHWTADARLGF